MVTIVKTQWSKRVERPITCPATWKPLWRHTQLQGICALYTCVIRKSQTLFPWCSSFFSQTSLKTSINLKPPYGKILFITNCNQWMYLLHDTICHHKESECPEVDIHKHVLKRNTLRNLESCLTMWRDRSQCKCLSPTICPHIITIHGESSNLHKCLYVLWSSIWW